MLESARRNDIRTLLDAASVIGALLGAASVIPATHVT